MAKYENISEVSSHTVDAYKSCRRIVKNFVHLNRLKSQDDFPSILRTFCRDLNVSYNTRQLTPPNSELGLFSIAAIDFDFIADYWDDNLDFNNPNLRLPAKVLVIRNKNWDRRALEAARHFEEDVAQLNTRRRTVGIDL